MTRRPRGQTLLEVFLAMILVSLIIFAVVGLYPGCMASVTRSHTVGVGSNLSMGYIESARETAYGTFAAPYPALPGQTIDDVLYEPTLTVDTTHPLGDANLVHITVDTAWNGTSSATYDYVLYNFVNPP